MAPESGWLRTWSTAEVSRVSGASLRELQNWDERGWLKPKRLQGRKRAYSFNQAIAACVIVELIERGLRRNVVLASLLSRLACGVGEDARYVVTDDKKLYVCTPELLGGLVTAMKRPIVVVDLDEIRDEVVSI